MAECSPEDVVASAMQPLAEVDVPAELRASIERQSHSMMGLATTLLYAGMDEQQVRTVIEQACASYRDELIAAILTLRGRHDI